MVEITNVSTKPVTIEIPKIDISHVTDADKGVSGSYIEWCLEYCNRKVIGQGVIDSDSDELEGRFPAGDANLNTSSLYYDALISASLLGKELGIDQVQLDRYIGQSKSLKESIDNFFSARIDGFETYRYYKGNDILRAWICTPLTVDIFDRKKRNNRCLVFR